VVIVSSWPRPTTADVGLRSFATTRARLFEETAMGMQAYLLESQIPPDAIHHSAVWTVQVPLHDDSNGLLLVQWLEEILFKDEVEEKWLVDSSIKIQEQESGHVLEAQVRWISSNHIEKEVEIKAVTRQDLVVSEVLAGQILNSPWKEVPTFEGPGWYSDVVFDI
tara:strand:- start:124 stop:618 length:495 start_codon:yes stop_codon:yes gene_type:complete